MKLLKLDTILLFALVIPFIMTYRIGSGETPYWLFGLIFFGLFYYLILDLQWFPIREQTYFLVKKIVLWIIIFLTIGSAYYAAIIVRHQTAPIYGVHDIILQQEAAVRFFLHGKNPYASTYFGTPLEQWHYSDTEINPALYHFVMEPFYLLFPIPFYLILGHTIGFFDARIPLFFLFIGLLIAASLLVKDENKKRLFLVLLAFNPAMLGYFLEGRDDIFMYAFLFTGFYLLYKKHLWLAGIPIAIAFATKQSAWPVFPFYAAFLYFQTKQIREAIKVLLPFLITFSIIVLPFFFWNSQAFLSSTIYYLSGTDPHSYPVAGYGLGSLLYQSGFIKNVHAYYPFWIWQVIIAGPLLVWLVLWQKKANTAHRLILIYGIFLFVFWYLSRYFNNSHLGYLSIVFITAYFFPEESKE